MRLTRRSFVVLGAALGLALSILPAGATPIACSCSYCETHLNKSCDDGGTTVSCSTFYQRCQAPEPVSSRVEAFFSSDTPWLLPEPFASCQEPIDP